MKFKMAKGVQLVAVGVILALGAAGALYVGVDTVFKKVPVMAAIQDIQAGDPLKEDMFEKKMIPKGGLPEGALKPPVVFDELIASRDMLKGDVLRKANSVNMQDKDISVLASRLATLKDKSLVGVDLPVDSIDGMLGGMSAGNHVIIAVGWQNKDAEMSGTKNPVFVSEIVAENVPVVGLKPGEQGNGGVLSVALTMDQYNTYIQLKDKGKITIGLHPLGYKK